MQGKRKWLLAVLTLVMGGALAFTGQLTEAFVGLALAVNGVHAAGNGWEHTAKRGQP